MNYHNKNQSGMTLIGILIASSIMVVLVTYIATILFDIAQFDLRSQSDQYITGNSRFIVSKLEQDISRSDSIININPGQTSQSFSLVDNKGEQIDYYLEEKRLVRESSYGKELVSSNLVEAEDFLVTLVDDTSISTDIPALEIDLKMIWLGKLKQGQKQDFIINTTFGLRK